jgi:acyl carrier protein
MERPEISEKVSQLFREVLDNGQILLTDSTTAADVAEWDSLNHIQLVVAVERAFRVRFASGEIQRWKNVGEMIDSIQAKLNKQP